MNVSIEEPVPILYQPRLFFSNFKVTVAMYWGK